MILLDLKAVCLMRLLSISMREKKRLEILSCVQIIGGIGSNAQVLIANSKYTDEISLGASGADEFLWPFKCTF